MRHLRALLLLMVPVCWAAVHAAQSADRFTPLFDGRRLTGWVEMGRPGAYVAANGIVHLKAPQNYPNWLRTEREYENFVLRLEYMVTGWCESGILLHAPLYGDLPRTGLKLHLRHDRSPGGVRAAGALYDLVPPLELANKGPHEWNALEIHMNWPSLRVTLNDVLIQDLKLDRSEELRSRARRGYIGLEDLGFEMKYRNIAIRELPDTDRPWRSLFNKVDLEGWVPEGEARWVVEDGKIVGSDGDGSLLTNEEFSAFELQTYFRTTPHANGGIFYRRNASSNGEEIQIYNVPGSTYPTGSIYGHVPAQALPCRDGEWCQLRMISDGAYTGVWVNGWKVAESWSMASTDRGKIGLQNHSEGRIEYLDPKVRSLPITSAP